MPKMKTHSGSKKRFKKTAGGKWLHRKSNRRHLLTGMSARHGRNLRKNKSEEKNSNEAAVLRTYLPYK